MQLLQTYNETKVHRSINSELKLFETSVWLHAFSRSLISIFIPILLLRLGYSVQEVIFYYFLYNLFDVPISPISRWLVRKIGARLVVIISSLFSIAFFLALYNLEASNWYLLTAIALLAALYDSLYWIAHIYLFMVCSKNDNNISKDMSSLVIIRRLAGIIAPALGAAVLILFNSKALIIVSVSMLAVSIWPLFKIKKLKDKPTRPQKKFKNFFSDIDIVKDYISVSLFSIHRSAENVIWPIFIYTLFNNIQSVAALSIIVSISSIIFTYFIGKMSKQNRSTMIIVGSFLIATTWILRLILDDTTFYYISVFMVGFFAIMVSLPLDSDIYEKGEKIDTLSASMYRNGFSMGGKAVFYFILIILLNIFNISFLTATISLLLLMMLNYFFIIKHKILPQPKIVKL